MTQLDVRLHVGRGTTRGPLTVFPVWTDAHPTVGPATGTAVRVDVAERPDSPAVDRLVVTNQADSPALLLAGELLEGGLQNRALTGSVVLAPQTPTVLPVVCVEEHRWGGTTTHQRQARRAPLSLLPGMEHPDGQAQVWRRVSRFDAVAGPSPTGSLIDRLDHVAAHSGSLTSGLRPLIGQQGLLVGVAGRAVWLELFGSPEALAVHWPGLLEAATLDALGRPSLTTPGAQARMFAERVQNTQLTHTRAAGLGQRVQGGGRVRVDSVRWPRHTVHLSAIDLTHACVQEAS